jgi:hypothetical protein
MKIQTTCTECSKSFTTTQSNLNRGRGHCCSRACSSKHANHKPGTTNPPPGFKHCSACQELLPLESFPTKKDGQKTYRWWLCTKCRNRYYQNHRKTHITNYLLISARTRSKKNQIEFKLTKENLTIPTHCPVLGLKLEPGSGFSQDNSPTIDRIDPTKGYVPTNIKIISQRANRLKGDGTAEEHNKIASYIKQTLAQPNQPQPSASP